MVLSVDSSSYGLGATLMQDNHPVAYASKILTKAQQNYAQIEKEMLAIVFGCQHFHQYIYGNQIKIETDHKPLVNLMRRNLAGVTARLQKLMLKVQKYDLMVNYKPGKEIIMPDALSRFPLNE